MLDKYHVVLAVGAFILDKEKRLLIVKKSPQEKVDGGLWTIPGGKVDPKEPIIDALLRETLEEVNLKIKPVRWIGEDVFESSGYFYHAQHFLCRAYQCNVTLEKNLTEYHWLKKPEINKFEFPVNIKKRILEII